MFLQLIYQTSNPGIHYEYVVRKPTSQQSDEPAVQNTNPGTENAAEEPDKTDGSSNQPQPTPVRKPTFSSNRPVSVNPIRASALPEVGLHHIVSVLCSPLAFLNAVESM